jgi:uncharacterized membrane protein (DUF4010 family)
MDLAVALNLAIALGLGLLVGVERQRAEGRVAGLRTFALITLLGAVGASVPGNAGVWLVAVGFAGVVALIVTGNVIAMHGGRAEPGMTTEIAALIMFVVGAAVASGFRVLSAVVGGTVALLLHWKKPMHAVVQRLGEQDVNAAMRLVLIGLVILPILPNRTYGPYGVLNPFEIWLMVVLIVGISLASYIAWRLFGARMGTLLGGALGGLISSTAATVGYARRTRQTPGDANGAAVMILIASTVVFVRVLFEVSVVARAWLVPLGAPVFAMLVIMAAIAAVTWLRTRSALTVQDEAEPPSDLRAAILFGLLYGAVLVAVAFAREHAGTGGLYAVAALSGLTDVDAITLSTAQLVRAGRLEVETGWRLILVGAMANLVFKGAAVAALGHARLTRRVASLFAVALAGAAIILVAWPG